MRVSSVVKLFLSWVGSLLFSAAARKDMKFNQDFISREHSGNLKRKLYFRHGKHELKNPLWCPLSAPLLLLAFYPPWRPLLLFSKTFLSSGPPPWERVEWCLSQVIIPPAPGKNLLFFFLSQDSCWHHDAAIKGGKLVIGAALFFLITMITMIK